MWMNPTSAVLDWVREQRRLLLIVAWLIWSLSLSAPAIKFPNIIFLSGEMIKVRSLVLYGIIELSPAMGPGAEILPYFGMIFFIFSPLTMVARAGGRIVSRLGWVMAAGLLLPWGMPVLHVCVPDLPFSRVPLMWGFYLFAAAQTLAFVACAVGPPKAQRASPQRGFAVLPPVRPPPPVALRSPPRPRMGQRPAPFDMKRGKGKGERGKGERGHKPL